MIGRNKKEIIKNIIEGLNRQTLKYKIQWDFYSKDSFMVFDYLEEDAEQVKFDFKKKHLRNNYKDKGIEKIKIEESIYSKKELNDDGLRISIIKCKREKVEDVDKNEELYLLICDFDSSDSYENIAESDSFPEIVELYELSTFICSKEIQEVIECLKTEI